jgi:hypothetical protein
MAVFQMMDVSWVFIAHSVAAKEPRKDDSHLSAEFILKDIKLATGSYFTCI